MSKEILLEDIWNEEKIKNICSFINKIKKQKDLDPNFNDIVNENFNDLTK